jgi:hypothetical protein
MHSENADCGSRSKKGDSEVSSRLPKEWRITARFLNTICTPMHRNGLWSGSRVACYKTKTAGFGPPLSFIVLLGRCIPHQRAGRLDFPAQQAGRGIEAMDLTSHQLSRFR